MLAKESPGPRTGGLSLWVAICSLATLAFVFEVGAPRAAGLNDGAAVVPLLK